MKTGTIGIILIVLGGLMIGYTSFNYVTTERVVDLGPVKIDKEKNHSVQWPPIVGAVLLAAGMIAVVSAKKNRS